MALTIVHEEHREGIRIRLIEQDIASFAIVYTDGVLSAIAHRTSDLVCAHKWFAVAVELAERGFITHPAWKKPEARTISININGDAP